MRVAMLLRSGNEDHTILSPPMPDTAAAEWLASIEQSLHHGGERTVQTDWAVAKHEVVLAAWLENPDG